MAFFIQDHVRRCEERLIFAGFTQTCRLCSFRLLYLQNTRCSVSSYILSDRWHRDGPRSGGIQPTSKLQSATTIPTTRHGAELGYRWYKFIEMSRFSLDIDYRLCTRRAETANIGEWTIQAPIPKNRWGRQSVSCGEHWD